MMVGDVCLSFMEEVMTYEVWSENSQPLVLQNTQEWKFASFFQ